MNPRLGKDPDILIRNRTFANEVIAMWLERAFDAQLTSLLKKRTHQLIHSLWPHPGKPPDLKKTTIESAIAELQRVASAKLLQAKATKDILRTYTRKKQ
jgi:hypothetical protein